MKWKIPLEKGVTRNFYRLNLNIPTYNVLISDGLEENGQVIFVII